MFILPQLLDLSEPIEVVCPACDWCHVWDPATLKLSEPDKMIYGEARDPE